MQSNNTIQGAIDLGMEITAYCHRAGCAHRSKVDLFKLSDRLGPDHGALYDDLKRHLVCSRCGNKDIGLIYGSAGEGKPGQGTAHSGGDLYQKARDGR